MTLPRMSYMFQHVKEVSDVFPIVWLETIYILATRINVAWDGVICQIKWRHQYRGA